MTIQKIKIIDDDTLRNEIDSIYEKQPQIILAKWSIEIAKRMIGLTNLNTDEYPEIAEGFQTNKLWQKNQARMHDVRQASFKIHKTARIQTNEIVKSVFRVIGHAIGSGHMKEHSIVASDYAIKVINLVYNKDIEKVKEERLWQLNKLIELSKE